MAFVLWVYEKVLVMEDIGLFKQGWQWLGSQKDAYWRARTVLGCCRDKSVMFIEQHWPLVCSACFRLGSILSVCLVYWRECFVRGFQSFIKLGPAMLLLIMWCSLLSLTSMHCLIYVLISMVCSHSSYIGLNLSFLISDLCACFYDLFISFNM